MRCELYFTTVCELEFALYEHEFTNGELEFAVGEFWFANGELKFADS